MRQVSGWPDMSDGKKFVYAAAVANSAALRRCVGSSVIPMSRRAPVNTTTDR